MSENSLSGGVPTMSSASAPNGTILNYFLAQVANRRIVANKSSIKCRFANLVGVVCAPEIWCHQMACGAEHQWCAGIFLPLRHTEIRLVWGSHGRI